eukprot:900316-Amphidinium_carterae.1
MESQVYRQSFGYQAHYSCWRTASWNLLGLQQVLREDASQVSGELCSRELESGYPTYALYSALDMYAQTTHGMPPGCGHAVDQLHAFLLKALQSAGSKVEVRKYVDDMVLVTKGHQFALHLNLSRLPASA